FYLKERNGGACQSRNIAIRMARGKYITGLDDDDYFVQDRLLRFMENKSLLEKHQFLVSRYISLKGEKLSKGIANRLKSSTYGYRDLFFGNVVGGQIFTLTDRLAAHLFDESLEIWQDLDLWFRLLSKDE